MFAVEPAQVICSRPIKGDSVASAIDINIEEIISFKNLVQAIVAVVS